MWQNAEIVGLLDCDGRIRFISRNEEEALIHNVVGRLVADLLSPASIESFEAAFQAAIRGNQTQVLLAGLADEGFEFWGRAHVGPSPEPKGPGAISFASPPAALVAVKRTRKGIN